MMKIDGLSNNVDQVAALLVSGKLVVLRTDTIYGILARADDQVAVENLHVVRNREPGKAFIVLIPVADAAYGADAAKVNEAYARYNPIRPTSVVIEDSNAPQYLQHRDGSLAYRMPQVDALQRLLAKTGPLVAPSANPAGLAFSRSIAEAEAYFGDQVAAYVDDGVTPDNQRPSNVVKVALDGTITKIR
jgi:Putative translation factor (SUA5)